MLVLSALVVGSLAPDFHYFLNLGPRGHFSHSIKGAFLFCLPVGLAVLWIFHTVMKLPLISLASRRHQERLARLATPFRWGSGGRFILIVCSLILGTFSHIAWDAFTHDRGFVVRNLPELRTAILEEFGNQRPLYKVLQYGSSLLGMSALVFWYWRWFKRTPPQPIPSYLQLNSAVKGWTVGVMLASAAGPSLVYGYIHSYHLVSRPIFVGTVLVTLMSVVFVEALLFSLWWQWRRSNQQSAVSISEQHSAIGTQHSAPGHHVTRPDD